MAIYFAGQEYQGLYAAGVQAAKVQAGGADYHDSAAPAVLALRHTYTITVGMSAVLQGYWLNNLGNITDATYALPNGSDAVIRQTMISNPSAVGGGVAAPNELRFLINQSGLGIGDVAQFPRRLVVSRGTDEAVCEPQSPDQIAAFGQGIGRDYARMSGTALATIFANTETVTVKLYY